MHTPTQFQFPCFHVNRAVLSLNPLFRKTTLWRRVRKQQLTYLHSLPKCALTRKTYSACWLCLGSICLCMMPMQSMRTSSLHASQHKSNILDSRPQKARLKFNALFWQCKRYCGVWRTGSQHWLLASLNHTVLFINNPVSSLCWVYTAHALFCRFSSVLKVMLYYTPQHFL